MTEERQTVPQPPTHEIGPARFQRLDAAPPERNRLHSVGAGLLLLLLVVGVPVGLVVLDAVPGLPTSLPTREQLTATIGVEQVLGVFMWVVWLAWFQFTISVLVELRSAISGVGLPARVPLAGPSQRLARSLVVAALMLVATVGPASAIAPESHEVPAVIPMVGAVWGETDASPVVSGTAGDDVAAQADVPQLDTAGATYRLGDLVLDSDEGAALVGQPVYVVHPPEGRHHDNLWDIAERTLGDGRRYQEIFDLNEGRLQPDGQRLSLARLIHPNWLLVMPTDAVGVERVVAVEAPAPDNGVDADEIAGASADTAVDAQPSAIGEAPSVVYAPTTGTADVMVEQADLNQQLLGAGLLAACVLAAIDRLRRKRRTPEPSHPAVEVEVALRVAATPNRAALLDTGLRHLAATLRSEGRPLPGVFAARVDDSTLTLHLAPADVGAPAPWRSTDGGRRWILDTELPARMGSRTNQGAPFPGLISLGRDSEDADVLIDLEAAQGPIAVVGDPAAAVEVVTAIAVELATNTWSDALRVTGIDLPDELADLGLERYGTAHTVAVALPGIQRRRVEALGAGVLSGRLVPGDAGAWVPEYLVVGGTPDPTIVPQLLELAATDARSPLGVVCVGDFPGARWRLEVDATGSLNVRLLDVEVRANRLSRAQVTGIAELLTAVPARDQVDERRAVPEHEAVLDRPSVDPPVRPVDRAAYSAAHVRVQVFGNPRVQAPHPIDADRVALATELVVFLALHPEGVHPNVLAAALWPHGVTAQVGAATVARAREWLGIDASGTPHLREGGDGRLRLGPGVVLDWDVVRTLLATARAVDDPTEERHLTAAALAFAAGPVLAERPPGRYAWLARVRLERSSRDLLVDAAHRLAFLSWHDDDPGAARQAAFAGLWVSPTEELLWRDVLWAAAAMGDVAVIRQDAEDMLASLRAAGVPELSPPTAALLEELMPGDDTFVGAVGRA